MFRPIDADTRGTPGLELRVDGRAVHCHEGENLALALLRCDAFPLRRTPVSAQARAPLCLMGVCFDCLVQVDGQANVQACMVTVRAGMDVRGQHGARAAQPAP